MEPSIVRVLVLSPARGAHRKPGHGGVLAVIGKRGDDRESRSAVRAGDERVTVSAVCRIDELVQAVRARRDIGRGKGASTIPWA